MAPGDTTVGQGLAGSPGKGNYFRLGAVRKAIRRVSRRHVIGKARRARSCLCRAATADAQPDLLAARGQRIGLVAFVTDVAPGLAWGSGSTARTVAAADAVVR